MGTPNQQRQPSTKRSRTVRLQRLLRPDREVRLDLAQNLVQHAAGQQGDPGRRGLRAARLVRALAVADEGLALARQGLVAWHAEEFKRVHDCHVQLDREELHRKFDY